MKRRRRRPRADLPPRCTLCDHRAVAIGVWVPSPDLQPRFLAPKGKVRTVVYALCREHAKDPEASGRQVEDQALDAIGLSIRHLCN